jgi:hypothetical protein
MIKMTFHSVSIFTRSNALYIYKHRLTVFNENFIKKAMTAKLNLYKHYMIEALSKFSCFDLLTEKSTKLNSKLIQSILKS